MTLTINYQRVFLPTKNFEQSVDFYERMGWTIGYRDQDLALMELGASYFFLQRAYVKEWAENMMLNLVVDDAKGWFDKATKVKAEGGFETVSVGPPHHEPYGATVVHLIDPAGVCLHFAQFDK